MRFRATTPIANRNRPINLGTTLNSIKALTVYLHRHPIGTITYLGDERTIFTFSEEYRGSHHRPTLGLRFKDSFGGLISEFRPYRIRLMPFFSNLLPEGSLRTYLAEKAEVRETREFFLLRALGQDLPGAVTVTELGERIGHDHREDAENIPTDTRTQSEPGLHFSLAGVQLKFSAVQTARFGLTIPANGVGGDWIVKLPAREFSQVPENEFSMMTLARMVGINVPEIALIDVQSVQNLPVGSRYQGEKAFAIRRFDRNPDGSQTHIEDFAQVFDVYAEDKYKKASMRDIAKVLISESDLNDMAECIRRITFNVLNWSLIYPDRQKPRLSPAYDFVSTIPYIPGDQFALKFSRSRRFSDFTLAEMEHFSAKVALPGKFTENIIAETIARFMQTWAKEKKNIPAQHDVIAAIDRHLQHLPILHQV